MRTPPDSASDFAQLVQMQELFFESETTLNALQSDMDKILSAALETLKKKYIDNKVIRDQSEAAIKALAMKHPEWKSGQTIKTPFGVVEFRKSQRLEVASEPRAMELIQGLREHPEEFINITKELDLEALERLDDTVLEALGIARVNTEKITVKPAKFDMGKAAAPATVSTKAPKKAKA